MTAVTATVVLCVAPGLSTVLAQKVDDTCDWEVSDRCMLKNEGGDVAAVQRAAIWKFTTTEEKKIEVCWENPDPKYQAEMTLVKGHIEKTWNTASALKFAYWGKCAATPANGVRIRVVEDDAELSRATGLGIELDKRIGGLVFNFGKGRRWETLCADIPRVSTADRRAICIRAIAAHEFGHALGLAHENMRADDPGDCLAPKDEGGAVPDEHLTDYDPTSVMNYCNRLTSQGMLSGKDRIAAELLYCPPDEPKCDSPSTRSGSGSGG